ncbi:hypothetical protein LNTAR_14612 [Lentisphaera araneosa HTCC2155]|uniref:General secretion pathway GspH domain-containing protein n=2 Tax=Lentisphaera TaxID=256846 RepID=A6DHH4_9BACT|nr:hypothetical protein LNTAR_14612 [Lentisphaera araneosa HTCC2155]
MSTKSFKKNFSLIELLAVIAIMSMLIAIVGAAMKPDPVNSATREISGAINKARSYALSKRKYTVLRVTQAQLNKSFVEVQPIAIYTDSALLTLDSQKTIPGSTTIYLNKGSSTFHENDIETSDPNALTTTYISFHPNGGVNSTSFGTNSGKYSINIYDRRGYDSGGNYIKGDMRIYVNKFTGMVSF